MEPIYIFGLEHQVSLNGSFDVAITDVWIPKGYANPYFPSNHDVPVMVVETSTPLESYSMDTLKALPCIYVTPHETLNQWQTIRALSTANTTPLTFDYSFPSDEYFIGYPADLPSMRLWIHQSFVKAFCTTRAILHNAFQKTTVVEGQPYYIFDSTLFVENGDKLYLRGSRNILNELAALKPRYIEVKCLETKTPQCAVLDLGDNHFTSDNEIEQQHNYEHFTIKHPNFVPLLPGIHSKLTFALGNIAGEALNLCSKAPPIILKIELQKSMSNLIATYLEAENGDVINLAQPLIVNQGRSMYQVGLASLSFTTKFPFDLTLDERTIKMTLNGNILSDFETSMTCPEYVTSHGELIKFFILESHGAIVASLSPSLKLTASRPGQKVTLRISSKLWKLLGGVVASQLPWTDLTLRHGASTVFPRPLQLSSFLPIYVKSTLARQGLLRILPHLNAPEGIVNLDFDRIDYFPMSVDAVTKLDLSLTTSKDELIPVHEKMVAKIVFKKMHDRIQSQYYEC